MAFVINSSERGKWYYLAESTFGTAIAASSSSLKEIVFEKSNLPVLGVQKSNLNQNRVSRVLSLTDLYNDNYSGPFDIPFSCLMSIDRAADFIYANFQNRVSQGLTGTGFSKVFKPHASQPDFTANAGMFFTLYFVPLDHTTAAVRYTSCIVKELTFDMTKESAGDPNIIRMSGVITAKKVETDITFTGSGTAQTTNYYLAHQFSTISLTIYGTGENPTTYAPNWATFSLSNSNNAIGQDKDGSGNPVTYFLNPGEGIKASLKIWFDATSKDCLYSAKNGSIITLSLSKGTVDTSGYFKIDTKGIITNNPISDDADRRMVPIEMQLGNSTATSTDGCTITIADAINQT